MGLYLSKTQIYEPIYWNLPYIPQVESLNIITDIKNWTLISGEYIAVGGEKYLTIGNFRNDANTQRDTINPNAPWWNSAYYYIDDVSVYCVDSGYTTATAGKDTIICKGDSVMLG